MRKVNRYSHGLIKPSQITPESKYLSRRALLAGGLGFAAAGTLGIAKSSHAQAVSGAALNFTRNARYSVTDAPTSFKDVSTYNNYYEFGTGKADPAENAQGFRTKPWSVLVDGECDVKGNFSFEDIVKPHALEERIYRMRCVSRLGR